jgi:hypothetical protein
LLFAGGQAAVACVPGHSCLSLPSRRNDACPGWSADSGEAQIAGVETHAIEGVSVLTTPVAWTVADRFKHRSRIDPDVALEAHTGCLREHRATVAELHRYSRI